MNRFLCIAALAAIGSLSAFGSGSISASGSCPSNNTYVSSATVDWSVGGDASDPVWVYVDSFQHDLTRSGAYAWNARSGSANANWISYDTLYYFDLESDVVFSPSPSFVTEDVATLNCWI